MRILLTGGAGYVGSGCFRSFRRKGLEAFVLDDLSEGHRAAVDPGRLDVADLRDTDAVARVLRDRAITHVVHFAARTSVPESLRDPSGYWSTNVDGSRSLLEAMRADWPGGSEPAGLPGTRWAGSPRTAKLFGPAASRPRIAPCRSAPGTGWFTPAPAAPWWCGSTTAARSSVDA